MRKIGILIIILGIGLTSFNTYKYSVSKKEVDPVNIDIIKPKTYPLNLSPLIGLAIMGIGGLVFWQPFKK